MIVTERITRLKCCLCGLEVGPSYAYAYIIYILYIYNRAYKRVHIHAATANTVFMAWLLACTRHSLNLQYLLLLNK